MTRILGLSAGASEAAGALVEDGRVVTRAAVPIRPRAGSSRRGGFIAAYAGLVHRLVGGARPDGVAVPSLHAVRAPGYGGGYAPGPGMASCLARGWGVPVLVADPRELRLAAGYLGAGPLGEERLTALDFGPGATEILVITGGPSPVSWHLAAVVEPDPCAVLEEVQGVIARPTESEDLRAHQHDRLVLPTVAPRVTARGVWHLDLTTVVQSAERARDMGAGREAILRGVREGVARALAGLVRAVADGGPVLITGRTPDSRIRLDLADALGPGFSTVCPPLSGAGTRATAAALVVCRRLLAARVS